MLTRAALSLPPPISRHPLAARPVHALMWMLVASVLFAVMNIAAKQASLLHLPWQEVAAGRAGFGALTIVILARARSVSLVVSNRGLQWRRTLAGIAAMCCGFYCLTHVPVGDAVTVGSLSPLFLAIGARWLLGERSGASLFLAVGLGLVGVALLAGAQFTGRQQSLVGLGAGLIGAGFSALAMTYLRRLGQGGERESAEGVSLHFAMWATVVTLLLGVGQHVWPSATAWGLLVVAGVSGGLAQVAMTTAYGLDQAARVAATGYSGVLLTQLFAVWWLGETTNTVKMFGSALVIVSGVVLALGAMRSTPAKSTQLVSGES